MPELFSLKTADWTLVVWSKDIASARNRLKKTLQVRGRGLPSTQLYFSPQLHLVDSDTVVSSCEVDTEAIFFENRLYEFDFMFWPDKVQAGSEPAILHDQKAIGDAFHFFRSSLRGSINFGNDVGRFHLTLFYHNGVKPVTQVIAFEVFPVKMDLHTDIGRIQRIIDAEYPLWRFAFSRKTAQELDSSHKLHERFPLLWLAQFERLREQLEVSVRQIINAPHSRLLEYTCLLRADRLKGRLPPGLEQSVASTLANGRYHHRHAVTARRLSVDTPENRFVKMVLTQCVRGLAGFAAQARRHSQMLGSPLLSDAFFDRLARWSRPLETALNQPLFREVGHFDDMSGESLVLHQKSGYSGVYRVWQALRLYLDVLGNHAEISVKSVAELYEVWCFLEVRRILCERLGFREVEGKHRNAAVKRSGLEMGLDKGQGAAFHLRRGDVEVYLAHEPLFGKPPGNTAKSDKIYSWTTRQKPDIFLSARLADGVWIRWIFDAKYRIDNNSQTELDLAPDDAINQMHRYRDALIHVHKSDDNVLEKSRPVFGAFVLYPGWFEPTTDANYYREAIQEIGIGAFPLLPGQSNRWLEDFLVAQLGADSDHRADTKGASDLHFIREPSRIGATGMAVSRYADLTLVASLGSERDKAYKEAFQNGTARWYHTRLDATDNKKMQRAALREIRYCALAVHDSAHSKTNRSIRYLYEVLSVRLVDRSQITREQFGASKSEEGEYWLFELGAAYQLPKDILVPGLRDGGNFKIRLVLRTDLIGATVWSQLPLRYTFLEPR